MSSEAFSRIALGTVQFGLPYGIANATGQISRSEATAILDCGRSSGLDTLDTAIAYGESERRLGEIGVGQWRVVSKLLPVPDACSDVDAWVRDSVRGSLERLGIGRLYALLLHKPEQLLGARGDSLFRALSELKERQVVQKIGVSIYDPAELDVLSPRFALDLVQAPFNILDRRLAVSGWLDRLQSAGVEIHVRSVFLQGLLLMNVDDMQRRFADWNSLWSRWYRWLRDEALTPLEACLAFVMAQSKINRVVVGVDSLRQFKEVLVAARGRALQPPDDLMSEDRDLINPSRWSAT